MPTWYDDAHFLLYYEHNFSPTDAPQPQTGLDPDQVQRLLAMVRPDAVQYTIKGHAGYVPYASSFGNQISVPYWEDAPEELPALYRRLTRELGIRFVVAYSGLIDFRAAVERPEWLRINSSYNAYPNRALCPNTGYLEELMLPQLDEILERYQPDGVWTDGDNWSVSPCYCTGCLTDYQMLHGRMAPSDRNDPFWPQWLQFHRDSFQRYLSRVALFLHERDPQLVFASNSAFATHQPETPPGGIDRLSWDLSPAYSVRQAGMEARFMESKRVPFDLITWNQASARPWPQGRLPALPAYPKPFEQLAQEGAAILANGGRWTVWVSAYPDDALPVSQHDVVAQAAEFARARQEWCRGTVSAAYVAILHGDAAHRHAGNGLYDPGPSLDRIRGAHQAFLELHHPHDILDENDLLRELDRYRVIVLPEQGALSPMLDGPLTEWVARGGRLIASGRAAPRLDQDIPTFALEPVLGVRWTGSQRDAIVQHRDLPMRIAGPACEVALIDYGVETLAALLGSTHELRPAQTDYPAVTVHPYGEGEACYMAPDFFAAYHRTQYPGLRELLADVLDRLLLQPPLLTTAPPTVEVVWRRRGTTGQLHFVNHATGRSLAQNNAFVETVPPSPPFSVTVQAAEQPASVRLQPDGIEPEWRWDEGTLTVFVPPVHLHAVVEWGQ